MLAQSANRTVAATALVRMGQCHEKLGSAEAQKAYERVVREYADQAEQVKMARTRLTALAAASAQSAEKPRFRQVGVPFELSSEQWFGAALSPDGRAFALSAEGAIWIVPVEGKVSPGIAGEPRQLTPAMGAMGMRVGLSWSADGNWIAFHTVGTGDGGEAIYLVASRGGEPKRVAYRPPTGLATGQGIPFRLSLSPDGRVLAFTSVGEDGNLCVATVPVDGGVPRCTTDPMSGDPAFSPDGRRIVYVQRLAVKPYQDLRAELRMIPAGGGRSAVVTNILGAIPVWSPDGRMIAFQSLPTEISIVPVSEEGNATDKPTTFKLQLPGRSSALLAGWGADDRMGLLSARPERKAIYTVPALGGKATQVTPEGNFYFPRWSPDGSTIWFMDDPIWRTVPSGGGTVTEIHTGSNPRVRVAGPGGVAFSPNGKNVVFAGVDAENPMRPHLWMMPGEGGQPAPLTQRPATRAQDRFPCWRPGGKSVVFIRSGNWQQAWFATTDIYEVQVLGGETRRITSDSDGVVWGSIACSPDGKWVAFFSKEESSPATPAADTIKIKPLDSGEAKVLAKVEHVGGHEEISWSPDGRKLAYNAKGKIWVLPLGGGPPVEIETGLEGGQHHVAWSPDGDKIAFQGLRGGEPELWLMEDFVHLVTEPR